MAQLALKSEEKKAAEESEKAIAALKVVSESWNTRLEPQKKAVAMISERVELLSSQGKTRDANRLASVLGMFIGSVEMLDTVNALRAAENKEIVDIATTGLKTYAMRMSTDERAAKFAMGIAMSLQQYSKTVSGENDESGIFKKALSSYAKGDLEAGNRLLDEGMGSFFDKDIQRLSAIMNASEVKNHAAKLLGERNAFLHRNDDVDTLKRAKEDPAVKDMTDPMYAVLTRIKHEIDDYIQALQMNPEFTAEQMEAYQIRVAGWTLAMALLNRANDNTLSMAEGVSVVSGSDKTMLIGKFKANSDGFIAAAIDALDSAPKLARDDFRKNIEKGLTDLFRERADIISNWEKFSANDPMRESMRAITRAQMNMTLTLAAPSGPLEQTVPNAAERNYYRILTTFLNVSDAKVRKAIYSSSVLSFSFAERILKAERQEYSDLISRNRTLNRDLDQEINRDVKATEAYGSLKTATNLGISMFIPIYGIAYAGYNLNEGYTETGAVSKTGLALTIAGAIPLVGAGARLAEKGSRWARLVQVVEKSVGLAGLGVGSVIGATDAYEQYRAGKGIDAIMNSFVLLFPVAHMAIRIRTPANIVPARRVRPGARLNVREPTETPLMRMVFGEMRNETGGGSTDLGVIEQQTIDSALAKRAAKQPLTLQEEAAMRIYDAAEARLRRTQQPPASQGPAEAPIAPVEKPIKPSEPDLKGMSKPEKEAARTQYKRELEEYTRKMRDYNDYETRLDARRKRALVKVLTPLEKTATDIVDGASKSNLSSVESQDSINIIKALYNSAVELGKRTSDRMSFNTTLSRIYARENIKALMDGMEATDPEITTIKRFILSARTDMMERMRKGGKQISVGEAEKTIAGERMDSGDVAAINEALMRESVRNPTQRIDPRNPLEPIEKVFGILTPEQREPLIRNYVAKRILPEEVLQQVYNDHVASAKARLQAQGTDGKTINAVKSEVREKIENGEYKPGNGESELLSALRSSKVEQAIESEFGPGGWKNFMTSRDSAKDLDGMIDNLRKNDNTRLADALANLKNAVANDFFYIDKFGNDARRIARETAETSGAFGAKIGIDESLMSRAYRKGLKPAVRGAVAVYHGGKKLVTPSTSPATRIAVKGVRMMTQRRPRIWRGTEYVLGQAALDTAAYVAIRFGVKKLYDWKEERQQRELGIEAAGITQNFPGFKLTKENVDFANSQEGFDFLRTFYKNRPGNVPANLEKALQRTDILFDKSRINEFLEDGRKISQNLRKINELFAKSAQRTEEGQSAIAELQATLTELGIDKETAARTFQEKGSIQVEDIPALKLNDWKTRDMAMRYGEAIAETLLTLMGGKDDYKKNGERTFLANNPSAAAIIQEQWRLGFLPGAYLKDAMAEVMKLELDGKEGDRQKVLDSMGKLLLATPFAGESFLGRLEQHMIEQDPATKSAIKDIINSYRNNTAAMQAFSNFKPAEVLLDKDGRTVSGEDLYGDMKKLAELIANTPDPLGAARKQGFVGPAILGAIDKSIREKPELAAFINQIDVTNPDGKNGLLKWVQEKRGSIKADNLHDILDDLRKKNATTPMEFEKLANDSINFYRSRGWWTEKSPAEIARADARAAANKPKGAGKAVVKAPEAVMKNTDTGQVYGRVKGVVGAAEVTTNPAAEKYWNSDHGTWKMVTDQIINLTNAKAEGRIMDKALGSKKYHKDKNAMDKDITNELYRVFTDPKEADRRVTLGLEVKGVGESITVTPTKKADAVTRNVRNYILDYVKVQAGVLPEQVTAKKSKRRSR